MLPTPLALRRMRLPFACLIAAATLGGAAAQPDETGDEEEAADEEIAPARETRPARPVLHFQNLGPEQGLKSGDVRVVTQAPDGYLWFGTETTLSRYDGAEWKRYTHDTENEATLSESDITALAFDGDGMLWVGTHSGGLNRFDPVTGKAQRIEGLAPGVSSLLFSRSTGKLWVGTQGGGLYLMDPKTAEVTSQWYADNSGLASNTVLSLHGDETVIVGAPEGLFRFKEGANTALETVDFPQREVNAVQLAPDGSVWAGTDDGLYHLKDGKLTHYRSDPSDYNSIPSDLVTAVLLEENGDVWVGTDDGVAEWMASDKRFVRHPSDGGPYEIAHRRINSFYKDREGNVWINTYGRGSTWLAPAALEHYRSIPGQENSLSTNTVLQVYEDSKGIIWLGTDGGGLDRFDPEKRTFQHFRTDPDDPSTISANSVWGTLETKDGKGYWVGTLRGLNRFNPRTGKFRRYMHNPEDPTTLPADVVLAMHEDEGGLWVGTFGGGLARLSFESDEFLSIPDMPPVIYTIHEDIKTPNRLWIGTGQGVTRLDVASGERVNYTHDPEDPTSIREGEAVSLYQTPDGGKLYIGTMGGGLNVLDIASGKVTSFTTRSDPPFPDDYILCILADEQGRMWLSSTSGLYALNPESGAIRALTLSDGMLGYEYGMTGCHVGPSGKFLFAGTSGLNRFDPKDVEKEAYVPPVAITSVSIAGDELSPSAYAGKTLDLSYREKFLEVHFAALSFAQPSANTYVYRLKGLSKDWKELGNQGVLPLNGLGSGEYTLEIRGAGRDGVYSEETASLAFTVAPPPWLSWWAFGIYGLIVIGAGLGFARFQTARVQAVEQANRLETVERDLALTGAVQSGFLPNQNAISDNRFNLYGFYRAAQTCSGDWWWYEQPAPGRHSIVVGDVTGHGPGPAMVTAAVATAFRVQTEVGRVGLEEKLAILNEEVRVVGADKYHMTMCAVDLDENTGRYVFYSAGGPPILQLGNGRTKAIPCRGTPLGYAKFNIGRAEGQLKAGERLLIYTDGIPEITVEGGKLLGLRRFARMFRDTGQMTIAEAAATIVTESDRQRTGEQEDDWTFTIVELS